LKKGIALIGPALVSIAVAATPANADEPAPTFAGADCELHVWAMGRPNFTPKSNAFIKYTPPTAEQLADPNSTVNIFNASKRAEALGDEPLKALFPDAKSVSIIRHADVVDMDVTPVKSIKARLSQSGSECYGDLVVANLYALFPNPDAPYVQYGLAGGVLASAIAGGDRLVIDFLFQQWTSADGKPFQARRKNDTPLPHVVPASADMAAAVKDSADANLTIFAETVAKKRSKK
jgi:hypothetical protein